MGNEHSTLVNSGTWYTDGGFENFLIGYWQTKLGSVPQFSPLAEDGTIVLGSQNRLREIQIWGKLGQINHKLIDKWLREGEAVVVPHIVETANGETQVFINVADGIVQSFNLLGSDQYIEVVENLSVGGTIPVIVVRRYGMNKDTLSYKYGGSGEFNGSALTEGGETGINVKEVKRLLDTKEEVIHNNGKVRATILRNRIDSHLRGKPEIKGGEHILRRLDLVDNKEGDEIELKTTHIATTFGEGSVVGKQQENAIKNSLQSKVESQMIGGTKYTTFDMGSADGQDLNIISDVPQVEALANYRYKKLAEAYDFYGISVSYDSGGKGNDVEAKVDRVGDRATQVADRKKNELRDFWVEVMSKVMILDNEANWEGVAQIGVHIKVVDYRRQTQIFDKLDKIGRQFSPTDINMLLGYSEVEARGLAERSDASLKTSLTSLLLKTNGNADKEIMSKYLDIVLEVKEKLTEKKEEE